MQDIFQLALDTVSDSRLGIQSSRLPIRVKVVKNLAFVTRFPLPSFT